MKRKTLFSLLLALAVLALGALFIALPAMVDAQGPEPQAALGTAFTYQGQLQKDGSVFSDTCDFQFSLYTDPGGSSQVGSTQTVPNVDVENGLFTAQVDFEAGAFTGEARWLKIAVRCPTGSGSYASLTPLQALTPAPYALALPGLWTQQNATSPNLIGGYSGNWVTAGAVGATIGGGGDNMYPNGVTDNYGTVGGGVKNQAGDNAGTTLDAFYATVGGGLSNTASGSEATIGGGSFNTASGSVATVGGGGANIASDDSATVGGGAGNTASGSRATVGGGAGNTASGWGATVGGGTWITTSGNYATIGGGQHISVTGQAATVAGGSHITVTGDYAAVGGGQENAASGTEATVGGGEFNTASGHAATVGGGGNNVASGWIATVSGGVNNVASGDYATVVGGDSNTAQGNYAFAAGRLAKANHQGAFVWGDSTDADITSPITDSFIVRASGGVTMYTSSDLSTGAYLAAGSGSWSSVSDRNLKENFATVDGREVLAHLTEIPITTWNYTAQEPAIRHMGPMAQDFYAAFGLGEDERRISTVDADGVALAAVQGLYELSQEQAARIEALEAENAAQQEQIDNLEARLTALETALANSTPSLQSSLLLPGVGVLLANLGLVWHTRRGGGR